MKTTAVRVLCALLTLLCAFSAISCGDSKEYDRVEEGVEALLAAIAKNEADAAFARLSSDANRADFDERYPEIVEKYAPTDKLKLKRLSESAYDGVGTTEYTVIFEVKSGDKSFFITASAIKDKEGLSAISFHDENPTLKK